MKNLRMVALLAEVRTQQLPNTRLEIFLDRHDEQRRIGYTCSVVRGEHSTH
jgi:hypothetical protein